MSKRRNNKSKSNGGRMPQLASTPDGLSFLKCAIASPDFAIDSVSGVPDGFGGRTIVKRHRFTVPLTVNTGSDTYIACAPIPGIAYLRADLGAGAVPPASTTFTGAAFGDSPTLFPTNVEDLNVNKFRYVGMYLEFIPLTNATNWTGSISIIKVPLTTVRKGNGDVTIDGMQSITNFGASTYIAGNNMGAYAVSMCTSGNFPFTDIITLQNGSFPGTFGIFNSFKFTGLGDCETIVAKISAVNQVSYQMRIHHCVEYQVPTSSILYDYSRMSPPLDLVAIAAYRKAASQLPVAVSYFENDGFWQRFLALFTKATSLGSYVPGPFGMASGGLNMVGQALQSLNL